MELENKLAAYRAKKKREERIEKIKDTFKNLFTGKKVDVPISSGQTEPLIEEEVTERNDLDDKCDKTIVDEKPKITKPEKPSLYNYGFYGVGFTIWAYLYYIFIQLQFGIIYLLVSALFGIYFNTRTGPRDENEISAYSVFNKNCESIDGTLKAEQFEREIRYGGL